MKLSLSILAAALATAVVPAQKTIIVDASGGGDYTDTPPAVAAAADGDLIMIRPGVYSAFSIDRKALSVVGIERVTISRGYGGITVSRLAAGRDVVIANLEISMGADLGPELSVSRCDGRVLLDRLTLQAGFFLYKNISVNVESSQQVLFQGCVFRSSLISVRSRIAVTNCRVFGANTYSAMYLTEGSAEVARSSFVADKPTSGRAPAAISMHYASLRITDDGTNVVVAGDTHWPTRYASAIEGTGHVLIDPNVVLRSTGDAPAIAPSVSVQYAFLPAVVAHGARLGEVASVELSLPMYKNYFLFWSNAGNVVPLAVLGGDLWLDPGSIVLAGAGSSNYLGQARFSFRVPQLTALIGTPFHWQAIADTPQGRRLSNPSGFTLTQ